MLDLSTRKPRSYKAWDTIGDTIVTSVCSSTALRNAFNKGPKQAPQPNDEDIPFAALLILLFGRPTT